MPGVVELAVEALADHVDLVVVVGELFVLGGLEVLLRLNMSIEIIKSCEADKTASVPLWRSWDGDL